MFIQTKTIIVATLTMGIDEIDYPTINLNVQQKGFLIKEISLIEKGIVRVILEKEVESDGKGN